MLKEIKKMFSIENLLKKETYKDSEDTSVGDTNDTDQEVFEYSKNYIQHSQNIEFLDEKLNNNLYLSKNNHKSKPLNKIDSKIKVKENSFESNNQSTDNSVHIENIMHMKDTKGVSSYLPLNNALKFLNVERPAFYRTFYAPNKAISFVDFGEGFFKFLIGS